MKKNGRLTLDFGDKLKTTFRQFLFIKWNKKDDILYKIQILESLLIKQRNPLINIQTEKIHTALKVFKQRLKIYM